MARCAASVIIAEGYEGELVCDLEGFHGLRQIQELHYDELHNLYWREGDGLAAVLAIRPDPPFGITDLTSIDPERAEYATG